MNNNKMQDAVRLFGQLSDSHQEMVMMRVRALASGSSRAESILGRRLEAAETVPGIPQDVAVDVPR